MPPGELPLIIAAGLLVAAAGVCWHYRREAARLRAMIEEAAKRLERLQDSFAHFAPPSVVEHIIEGGIPTRGERMEVTVLFADLVGYTALAESLEPSKLVEIINGYFECMNRAITEHRGQVATFIGDGLLALFGAFEPNPWQGNDGVHAALAMREALVGYNRELIERGLPALGLGIGLHRDTGIAGLVGSHEKKEFTIIGRTINIAARVQSRTREHDADILLTGDLQRTLDPRFTLKEVGPTTLRGISDPITLYAVQGFDGPAGA